MNDDLVKLIEIVESLNEEQTEELMEWIDSNYIKI